MSMPLSPLSTMAGFLSPQPDFGTGGGLLHDRFNIVEAFSNQNRESRPRDNLTRDHQKTDICSPPKSHTSSKNRKPWPRLRIFIDISRLHSPGPELGITLRPEFQPSNHRS